MKDLTLKQALNTFNLFFITTFLVLALFSALGQQIFPYVGQYRVNIERYISAELGSEIRIRSLSGDMQILTPSIHLEGVSMSSPSKPDSPSLSIAAIDAELDPRASLLNLAPVFKSVRISGLYVHVSESEQDKTVPVDNAAVIQQFIEILLLQQHLELNNVTVEISRNQDIHRLHLDQLSMTGDGFHRLMTGSVTFGDENKIKAGVRLYSEGSPYQLENFYARGALVLPSLEVDYWSNKLTSEAIFDSFDASSQVNVEFKDGLLNYAKLNLASTKVAIAGSKTFNNVNTEIWLKQNNLDTWSLWLGETGFTLNDKKWQLNDLGLKLSKTMTGNRWQGFIKDADVEYLYDLIGNVSDIPESVSSIVSELQPTGRISNFSVIMQQNQVNEADNKFTAAGELVGVSTQASKSIPAVSNVHGVIAVNKNSGRVQFSGQDMMVDFPKLYHQPFKFLQGKGQVDWKINDENYRILGNGLDLEMAGVSSLKGGFDVVLPKVDSPLPGIFELNLSTTNTDVLAHPSLVPKVTPKTLNDWLVSALKGGEIHSGNFYYYDSVDKDSSDAVMELYLDAKNTDLAYLEGWPQINKLDGQLLVKNTDVYAAFKSGSSLGGELSKAQIVFKSGTDPFMWVDSQVTGLSSEMFSYFHTTPLAAVVKNVFDDWEMTGRQTTKVGLKIPMTGDLDSLKAQVESQLTESALKLNDVGITVNNVAGQVNFSTSEGLTSDHLSAQVWGENLTAKIDTVVQDRRMKSDIQFEGMLNTQYLKNWLKLSLLEPVSGSSFTKGHVYIDTDPSGFTGLAFNSDLKGVRLNLPGEFAKDTQQTTDFSGSVQFKDGQIVKMSYADSVNMAMKLKNKELISGQVYVGKTEAYIPASPGVVIDGHVAYVDLNEWIDTWNKIQSSQFSRKASDEVVAPGHSKEEFQVNNPVRLLNVSSDKFKYNDFKFDHVKAHITQENNVWTFNVDAPVAKGTIVFENEKPLNLDLEYVHWPMDTSLAEAPDDPLQNVDPKIFPSMKLKVGEVFLGPRNLGRWKVNVEPVKDGAKFSNIDGAIKKLNVKGDGQWIKPQDPIKQQLSNVSLLLTSNDVGGIQSAWQVKPAVEAEYGKVNTSLSWVGSPANPQLASINGKLDVNLKKGRFIEAGEAGSLSAFGLLNFSAIGRRLRLDFSDVYESGFHFDQVRGRTQIDSGVISIIDTLEIDGPSAKFASSGTIDLNTKALNQELSATFPITGTLPLMAIIAGFAPPVAASLFVGERLVGDEIEKFTSATYKLSGTWETPNLELMKRFDNDIEGKQDKSFWYRMKDFFGVGDD